MTSNSRVRVENLPRYFVFFIGAMVALGPFSIDTYLPALPSMSDYFGVGIEKVNFTLITYFLGYAVAQLIGGPLSDQVGRKRIGLTGLCIFIPASILISLSQDIYLIQALRAVQGFGGGFATIICMAMIRDAYEPEEAARKYPMAMMIMMLAPLLAPWLGSFLLPLGWQSNFVFLAVYAILILLLFVRLPETAKDLVGKIQPQQIFPQYKAVVSKRVAGKLIPLRVVLAVGMASGCLLVFISNVAFIYIEYYDVGTRLFPAFFGVNIVVMMALNTITMKLVKKYQPYHLFRVGLALQLTAISSLALVAFFGPPPLWVFTFFISFVVGCVGMTSPSATAVFMAFYDRLAGSAASVISVTAFMVGAPLAALSQVFFDGTVNPMIFVMFGSCVIANLIAATIPKSKSKQDQPMESAGLS